MPSFAATASTALLALYLCLAPAAVSAGVTAWDGNSCNGNVGLDVPCDGSCHGFGGRNSFRVDGGSGSHCVTVYSDSSCSSGGTGFFPNQDGQCTQVTLGTASANSFRCAPNDGCLN